MRNECDVLIIGSGVAGLLIAQELGDLRVTVLDRHPHGRYRTYCLTTEEAFQQNESLAAAAGARFSSTLPVATGDYRIWNRDALVEHLRQRVQRQGAAFEPAVQFLGIAHERDGVGLRTSRGIYAARLIVDCMGTRSPLAFHLRLAEVVGFSLVYSRIVRRHGVVPSVETIRSRVIETLPVGDGCAQVALITDARKLRHESSLERDLCLGVRDGEEILSETRGGVVPLVRLRSRAVDRVVVLDSADEDESFGNVVAMTEALRTRHATAKWIRNRLGTLQ